MSSPFVDTLAALKRGLAGIGRGWYLFGAQAALVYGSSRLTSDIDVTLVGSHIDVHALIGRLETVGLDIAEDVAESMVAETSVLPVVHRIHHVPVDIVLGGPGLEELFLEHAEVHQIGPVGVRVAAPEHLVLMKLLAGRDKDLEDAEAVTRAAPVDLLRLEPLIQHIAEALGEDDILDNLERLRTRVGIRAGSV